MTVNEITTDSFSTFVAFELLIEYLSLISSTSLSNVPTMSTVAGPKPYTICRSYFCGIGHQLRPYLRQEVWP